MNQVCNKECGYATPRQGWLAIPTAEAGGYHKDGRSATNMLRTPQGGTPEGGRAATNMLRTPQEGIPEGGRAATKGLCTPQEGIPKGGRAATNGLGKGKTPCIALFGKSKDCGCATSASIILGKSWMWVQENGWSVVGGCTCGRRATVFMVSPGFQPWGRCSVITNGVAEPHS